MVGWAQVTGRAMLSKSKRSGFMVTLFNAHPAVYPWGSLPAGSIVVDVGGGNGHATLNLLKAFPSLKIIVQDTRAVAVQGREVLPSFKDLYLYILKQLLVLGERVPDCDSRKESRIYRF